MEYLDMLNKISESNIIIKLFTYITIIWSSCQLLAISRIVIKLNELVLQKRYDYNGHELIMQTIDKTEANLCLYSTLPLLTIGIICLWIIRKKGIKNTLLYKVLLWIFPLFINVASFIFLVFKNINIYPEVLS